MWPIVLSTELASHQTLLVLSWHEGRKQTFLRFEEGRRLKKHCGHTVFKCLFIICMDLYCSLQTYKLMAWNGKHLNSQLAFSYLSMSPALALVTNRGNRPVTVSLLIRQSKTFLSIVIRVKGNETVELCFDLNFRKSSVLLESKLFLVRCKTLWLNLLGLKMLESRPLPWS